jgi:DnaJ like chaperone protein
VDARADENEIRAAYKRLLSRFHPDKIAGQHLSQPDLIEAQQRLQRVRDAYEFLRQRKS